MIEEIQQGDESRQSEIKLSEIRPNPYQPRKIFDDEKIGELAQSIKEHGVFTPVLLRKSVKGYELIAGERRVRASKKAGLKTIPAIVMEFTEEQMMEISLLENIQREDLNAIEEAQAYQRLIERLDYTQEKLAQRVGKSREHITNTLRLLKLPKSVQQLVTENKLSMGHVRPLVTIEDEGEAYDPVSYTHLEQEEANHWIMSGECVTTPAGPGLHKVVADFIETLADRLDLDVYKRQELMLIFQLDVTFSI